MARSELVTRLAQRFSQLVQKNAEMAVAEILGAIHSTGEMVPSFKAGIELRELVMVAS